MGDVHQSGPRTKAALREQLAGAVERLVALIDAIDGDADFEDLFDCDLEESLQAAETGAEFRIIAHGTDLEDDGLDEDGMNELSYGRYAA